MATGTVLASTDGDQDVDPPCGPITISYEDARRDLFMIDAAITLLPNNTDSDEAEVVLQALRDRVLRHSNGRR